MAISAEKFASFFRPAKPVIHDPADEWGAR